jgi:anti-sigma factor RsiW
MDCRVVQRHLSAFVDSELEPSAALELEAHLVCCAHCTLQRTFLGCLKSELRVQLAPVKAPDYLRARVERALAGVPVVRGYEAEARPSSHVWAIALSVAASVLLVTGSVINTDRGPRSMYMAAANGNSNPLDVVREVVDRHKDHLPVEISTQAPEQATSWFRDKVGFRVRGVEFSEPHVHFEGARMAQVGSNLAARLYYRVGDSQLTVVMFKPSHSVEQLLNADGLQKIQVSGREVPYRKLQGYTVPILQDDGIVYAFTGDLDERMLLQLVATARFPH